MSVVRTRQGGLLPDVGVAGTTKVPLIGAIKPLSGESSIVPALLVAVGGSVRERLRDRINTVSRDSTSTHIQVGPIGGYRLDIRRDATTAEVVRPAGCHL